MTPLERARGAIGSRFRVHGRCVELGVDCVGLAGLAFGVGVPRSYALRGGRPAAVIDAVDRTGLLRVTDARPGDLVLFDAGAGQLHFAVTSEAGVIHADAALRRVVERPGDPPWPALARWRQRED
ncbi:cell wall-associated NlpC family hydrolase [Sphingomonas sp. BE123]|uniref:peptidoglycan endopeptidase n=1 Tax=Sphingomonas sp. BE123 TaxID=2817842 RepID=UPI002859E809|nr:peptidoglycan endopeptidase [Sphingomonas sp. BE123]MDR6852143.1 cell wall-associated NlpC family hydrolase [Sphingomonas sp. BE123]